MNSLPSLAIWGCLALLALAPRMTVPAAAGSANQNPSPVSDEITKLSFLLGEWKGNGWRYRTDGSKSVEVSHSAKVKIGSDRESLIIDDRRKYPDLVMSSPFPGQVLRYPSDRSIKNTVFFDSKKGGYYWRIKGVGGELLFEMKLVKEKSLQVKWQIEGALALITIEITEAGEWHQQEFIWISKNNDWFKSEETFLKKVK